MPLSSRVTPREAVGQAMPFRLDSLAGASQAGDFAARAASPEAQAKRERDRVFQEGFRAGDAAARALAERERTSLAGILEGHDRELGRLNEDLARAVVALAVDLARHVTRAHVAVHEDAVLPVIQEALALVREDATPVRLSLSPADCALAERALGAELAQRACRLLPDASLGRGECRLEGAHARIDASLAARWRKAVAPLGERLDWVD